MIKNFPSKICYLGSEITYRKLDESKHGFQDFQDVTGCWFETKYVWKNMITKNILNELVLLWQRTANSSYINYQLIHGVQTSRRIENFDHEHNIPYSRKFQT